MNLIVNPQTLPKTPWDLIFLFPFSSIYIYKVISNILTGALLYQCRLLILHVVKEVPN